MFILLSLALLKSCMQQHVRADRCDNITCQQPGALPARQHDSRACCSQEEVIAFVRRRSNAFSSGKSRYRGVSGREGRWEVRIGPFAGLKNVSAPVSLSMHVALRRGCLLWAPCPRKHARI